MIDTLIVDKTWTNLLTTWILTAFNPTNAFGGNAGDSLK
jgi:hypothetical protein